MSANLTKLAEALAAGHRHPPAAVHLSDAPASYNEAMQVQAEVAGLLGASVAGWKVAIRPEGHAVAAPLLTPLVTQASAFAVSPQGLMGIEVEIGLRLAGDLPPRPDRPYMREDILAACSSVLVGIEVVSTRLPDQPNAPFALVLADNVSNGGYAIGDETTAFAALDLGNLALSVSIDGREVHAGIGGHGNGDPLVPVLAYVNSPNDRLGGFRQGQIVTTGTLCGLVPVRPDARIEASIARIGRVSLALRPRG